MMDRGTEIARICYEYFDGTEKKHRRFGSLFYFRNHSGGCPSAQLRIDMIPSAAWAKNPDVYFIGNFIESEKIPEAPYVCGQIFVPSDKRGERTYIGHIGTREFEDEREGTQFYFQLFGVPMREIKKGIHKTYMGAVKKLMTEMFESTDNIDEKITEAFEQKHSLYLGIELEG